MSFGRIRLLSAVSASAFCFWKHAECTSSDQNTPKDTPYTTAKQEPIPPQDFFMALALLASSKSKDGDTQVGACIVRGKPPLLASLGYNGMPDGHAFKYFEKEYLKPPKHKLECHAEVNAIVSAFRRQADLSESTLYVTHSPCSKCCKLILQSGLKNVVWAREYDEKVEQYMRPIREDAKRPNKGDEERFVAMTQYIEPLCEKMTVKPNEEGKERPMTVEKYNGEFEMEIDLGPSPWVDKSDEEAKSPTNIVHCKILGPSQKNGQEGEVREQKQLQGQGEQGGKGEQGEQGGKGGKGGPGEQGEMRGKGKRKVDISRDDYFMAIAKLATTQSTSEPKVGACLVTVDPHRAVSIGYGEYYKPPCYRTEKNEPYQTQKCAESNAIMSAFRVHADLRSSILYVTSPLCSDCAKIAVQSGVKAVVYAPSNEEKVEQDKAQERKQDEVQKKKKQEAVQLIFDNAGVLYREYRRQTSRRFIRLNLITMETPKTETPEMKRMAEMDN